MGVEVRQTGNVDQGVRVHSQVDGPVTFKTTGDNTSTGEAEMEPAEVTYEDKTHEGKPTGSAEQSAPITYVSDWPRPEKIEGEVVKYASEETKVKAKKTEVVEDKAVKKAPATKRVTRTTVKRTTTRRNT